MPAQLVADAVAVLAYTGSEALDLRDERIPFETGKVFVHVLLAERVEPDADIRVNVAQVPLIADDGVWRGHRNLRLQADVIDGGPERHLRCDELLDLELGAYHPRVIGVHGRHAWRSKRRGTVIVHAGMIERVPDLDLWPDAPAPEMPPVTDAAQ